MDKSDDLLVDRAAGDQVVAFLILAEVCDFTGAIVLIVFIIASGAANANLLDVIGLRIDCVVIGWTLAGAYSGNAV